MNLLVTNTRNSQAYAIIRALRPYSNKIVATMEGDNRFPAWLSHAARSRLVDKRYFTPSPAADWRAGRIQKENTEREEAYIQAVLKICEKEKLDTIFPSFDPHVYVFSKNKERFEKLGVLIPVPDYETVITPLDKYRTIKAAEEVGFPCPKTYLPQSEDDLGKMAEQLGFPLVIKPRFTAAGRGTAIVRDRAELLEKTRLVSKNQGMPMVQEYIPGPAGQKQSFQTVLDKNGGVKAAFRRRILRSFLRVTLNVATASESMAPDTYLVRASSLTEKLGWWGGASVETKVDPRDGVPKLLEINPRLGITLWQRTELDINIPLMCLKIAHGEEVEPAQDYPVGMLFLDPIEDLLTLGVGLLDLLAYKFRMAMRKKTLPDPPNPPIALKGLIQSYMETYFSHKKKYFNPYFRYFFQDPLVSILWWAQFSTLVSRALKQLGR